MGPSNCLDLYPKLANCLINSTYQQIPDVTKMCLIHLCSVCVSCSVVSDSLQPNRM